MQGQQRRNGPLRSGGRLSGKPRRGPAGRHAAGFLGLTAAVVLAVGGWAGDDAPNGDYGDYLTWPEMRAQIEALHTRRPDLVELSSLGKTAEGREIPLLKISDRVREEEGEPEVLVVGGVHPREQQPQLSLMRFLDELVNGYGTDAALTRLVNERVLWCVPMLNVDGKVYDFQAGNGKDRGADWRKNRRRLEGDARGVDLNRNFLFRWGGFRDYQETWKSATDRPAGNIYEGPAPLSEPETRALAAFLDRRPLRAFLDVHSPFRKLYYPPYLLDTEDARFRKLVERMAAAQADPYPIQPARPGVEPAPRARSGDTGLTYHHAYYACGIYGVNFEIGLTGRYPPPAAILEEYGRNVRGALLAFVEGAAELPLRQAGDVRLRGAATDVPPASGAVVQWTPRLDGKWDYAVLASPSPQVVVQSEFRLAPGKQGFTLHVAAGARPGDRAPLRLFVWDRERRRTEIEAELVIARNDAAG